MKYQAVQKKYCVLESMTYRNIFESVARHRTSSLHPIPDYFDTKEEAEQDIADLIKDVADAVKSGDMEEEYDKDDYKVAMLDMDEDGNVICYEIDQPNNIIVKFNAHEEYPNN